MSQQRVCVSATAEPRYEPPHDEEAWIVTDAEAPDLRAVMDAFLDGFQAYLTSRGIAVRTVHLETWPGVLEQYRREGLIR